MKTKEEYIKELSIIDGIKNCVFRYDDLVAKEQNNTQTEWCQEYIGYLNKREHKIKKKIHKLERLSEDK